MCNFSISALNIQSNQCCVHLLHSWMIVPTRVNVLSHVCLLAFPGLLKRRQQRREAVKSQVQACMFCFVILSSYLRCLFFNIPEVSLADLFFELSSTWWWWCCCCCLLAILPWTDIRFSNRGLFHILLWRYLPEAPPGELLLPELPDEEDSLSLSSCGRLELPLCCCSPSAACFLRLLHFSPCWLLDFSTRTFFFRFPPAPWLISFSVVVSELKEEPLFECACTESSSSSSLSLFHASETLTPISSVLFTSELSDCGTRFHFLFPTSSSRMLVFSEPKTRWSPFSAKESLQMRLFFSSGCCCCCSSSSSKPLAFLFLLSRTADPRLPNLWAFHNVLTCGQYRIQISCSCSSSPAAAAASFCSSSQSGTCSELSPLSCKLTVPNPFLTRPSSSSSSPPRRPLFTAIVVLLRDDRCSSSLTTTVSVFFFSSSSSYLSSSMLKSMSVCTISFHLLLFLLLDGSWRRETSFSRVLRRLEGLVLVLAYSPFSLPPSLFFFEPSPTVPMAEESASAISPPHLLLSSTTWNLHYIFLSFIVFTLLASITTAVRKQKKFCNALSFFFYTTSRRLWTTPRSLHPLFLQTLKCCGSLDRSREDPSFLPPIFSW